MSREHEELDELEGLLRGVPLTRPSAALDARVRNALAGPARWRWYASLATGSLAAAALVMLAFWPRSASIESSGGNTTPTMVAVQPSTEEWTDEGIVGYAADGPVRQYRVVEQYAWASGRRQTVESVVEYVSEAY